MVEEIYTGNHEHNQPLSEWSSKKVECFLY